MRTRLMVIAVTGVLSIIVGRAVLAAGAAPNTPAGGPPDAFQVRYASNLNIGDSFVNITNAGTQGGFDPAGRICANVYVFSPDEQMVACCSCTVTPNGLVSLSARDDLISNTLTPAVPKSIVVKLLATTPTGPSCGFSATTATAGKLAPGMRAWGSTLHALPGSPTPYGGTETAFSPAVLSTSELAKLTSECGFINTDGSGFGICQSCRLGGL